MYVLDIAITFVCLAAVVVALRMFTRLSAILTSGWDDLFIVLSLIVDFLFLAFLAVGVHYGLGKKGSTLDPGTIRLQLKALWVTIALYNLSLSLTKISMIMMYRRLFPTARHQIILQITLICVIVTGLWMTLSAFFFCSPVNAYWDPRAGHHCLSKTVVWSLNASIQIVTNIVIVILPMPVLTQLRLPRRQKFALIFVFALGLFVCATSAARLVMSIRLLKTNDDTKNNAPPALLSAIEINLAIISACLPTLRPLLAHYFPRVLYPRIRTPGGGGGQREKTTGEALNISNPFDFSHTSYSASVTGSLSICNADGQESLHCPPECEGIHVVSELRLETASVDEVEDLPTYHLSPLSVTTSVSDR